MSLLFDKSVPGRHGFRLPKSDVPEPLPLDRSYLREEDAPLCELSELEIMRHFIELSHRNHSIDSGFYQ